ncbi:killer cell lectin-like receptor subfamily F member 1 [Tachyglossus aculeatus]|uniref:killer cell lectin-like receptor subfamily F member 1 n=1 Tax=Tachyglossus aculeatus TaxID=9261 RepID=UPI0018F7AA25|nr:killer cell lectin-like receptor subfamily F member 1 [Tachyglossus aculeatus]
MAPPLPTTPPSSSQETWTGPTPLPLKLILLGWKTIEKRNCENDQVPGIFCEDGPSNKSSARLEALKEELCIGQQGAVCELCPMGWKLSSSRCYYFSRIQQSWESGARDCTDRKSQLLILEDEAEAVRIRKLNQGDEYFWIGYKFNKTQKQWTWMKNTGFSRYRITVKKHLPGNDCACFKREDEFTSQGCRYPLHWICKRNGTVLAP